MSPVIPTYNLATHVGDAIESVLRQTYRDFKHSTGFVATSYGHKVRRPPKAACLNLLESGL